VTRRRDVDKRRHSEKLRADMRRLLNIPWLIFALFFGWKVALLLGTSQPVPSNDAFFYDGPVVNYLCHGKYCNPSLAQVLPISGTEVFSAYPPLYQAVLFGWMKCFGTSALVAMWLHVLLLAVFALTCLKIFQQLHVPVGAMNLAGLFLFGITFHDRPDTLAHVLGALTVLALVRGLAWPAAVFLLLTFGTSLQIGGIYFLWAGLLLLGNTWLQNIKFPWAAALTFCAGLLGLVTLVKFRYPLFWEGFCEHVTITPSLTGLRLPRLDDLLKVARTAPGIALVLIGTLGAIVRGGGLRSSLNRSPALLVATAGGGAALALIGGCLFILTPNTIHIAGYLQVVIVGCFLGARAAESSAVKLGKTSRRLVVAAAVLVAIRAIGMTTWGVLCACDVSRPQALARVNAELDATPPGSQVFISAAFLYEAAHRTNVTWIHSDWPARASGADGELRAISDLKPAKLLLTQFDYYRRYETVVAQFRRAHSDVTVRIDNLAHVPSPDALPSTRKIVQHISWAPVIVEFSWPPGEFPKPE
jgi:hypothetical protein